MRKPIRPISDEIFESTLAHVPPVAADYLRLIRLTGRRPGEICNLMANLDRTTTLDRSGAVWRFHPPTSNRSWSVKPFSLDFECQAILEKYCSSSWTEWRHALYNEGIEERMSNFYKPRDLRALLAVACAKAYPHPTLSPTGCLTPKQRLELKQWQSAHAWTPDQARWSEPSLDMPTNSLKNDN